MGSEESELARCRIGREQELAEIARQLFTTRLLTLTGAGCVGKTRLALEAAQRALERFPDGVWLVDLAPLSDPALVLQMVAAAVGVSDQGDRPLLDRVVDLLGARVSLLLLDNCEHLIDACAQIAQTLLQTCPRLRLLATSRQPLDTPGEVAWIVPSLPLPDPGSVGSAEAALEFEAVRLFTERARAASQSFALDDQNALAVAGICEQLDGIPLALELAAARVRTLSAGQILRRLRDRFRLLSSGRRTAVPRHQTLRAVIDWSHDLLQEPERILFRRLSVFAGGWTLEAAESICGDGPIDAPGVLDLLSQLVDKSLVLAQPDGGEHRYRFYETLRQYAAEKLADAAEDGSMRGRHLVWFRDLAERNQNVTTGPEEAAGFSRLETELGNLRAGLDWARQPPLLEDGLRLAAALYRFWWLCGRAAEGEDSLAGFLQRTRPTDGQITGRSMTRARAAALSGAGFLASRQHLPGRSRPFLEEALPLWRELRDKRGITFTLWELGNCTAQEGDLEPAALLLEQSLAGARELQDSSLLCESLAHLGWVLRRRGEYQRAQELCEEGLAVARVAGDFRRAAVLLALLGEGALKQGNLDAARAWLRESLLATQRSGVTAGFGAALLHLARVAATESQPARTLRLAGAAAAAAEALGALEDRYLAARTEAEPELDLARQDLGGRRAEAAWTAGRAMTLERAIAYALGDDESLVGLQPEPATEAGPLTAREREISTLVARGLTNREIAAELFISEATAKRHVENILNKLGLSSRRKIRAWVGEQPLLATGAADGVVPFRPRHAGDTSVDPDSLTSRGG